MKFKSNFNKLILYKLNNEYNHTAIKNEDKLENYIIEKIKDYKNTGVNSVNLAIKLNSENNLFIESKKIRNIINSSKNENLKVENDKNIGIYYDDIFLQENLKYNNFNKTDLNNNIIDTLIKMNFKIIYIKITINY